MNRSHRTLLLVLTALPVLAACGGTPPAAPARTEARQMYARCNLKILKGNTLTWVNWQSAPSFIPAGTPLSVSGGPQLWSLRNEAGTVFTLDAGGTGDRILGKFVTPERVDVEAWPEEIRANVHDAVARVGMTREQVYVAMGPPASVDGNATNLMSYEQILAGTLWTYRRKRFGKNIGVRFHPADGIVTGTEGIWR